MRPPHILLIASMLMLLPAQSQSAIPGLEWTDPEVVDTGVVRVPGNGGSSFARYRETWWIVYEKAGDIFIATRGPDAWEAIPLTTDPHVQKNPQVAASSSRGIHVLWEDRRGAVPEVWTRSYDGMAWSAASVFSPDDGIASRAGVIAAHDVFLVAAWEDSAASGFRVKYRTRSGANWSAPQSVSSNPASQRDPSVAADANDTGEAIVWTDYRDGVPKIYLSNGWYLEECISYWPYPCRRPSIAAEACCGDAVGPAPYVVYESTLDSGVTEVFGVGNWGPTGVISADDGVSSVRPNAASVPIFVDYCQNPPGDFPRYFATWTEVDSGPRSHVIWSADGGQELTPGQGIATAVMKGAPDGGYFDHFAPMAVAWVQADSALVVRAGRVPSCDVPSISGQPNLLAPDGIPRSMVRKAGRCDDQPFAGDGIDIVFDAVLQNRLTWDPQFPQPPIHVVTDADGEAWFSLRGGGCSPGPGLVTATGDDCGSRWPGARSPDVDGDCVVGSDDLAYVESKVGTSDFCADLDASGGVDDEDVAIVQMTLWDHCSNVTGVEGMQALPTEPSVHVYPNPATKRLDAHLVLPGGPFHDISIVDSGGRRLRSFSIAPSSGIAHTLTWDLLDDEARRVPAGIYFLVVSDREARRFSRTIVVRD